jgi:hypothetical protein
MTNNTNTEPATTPSRKPNLIAYSVRDRGEGKDSKWTEIGVAFAHKDQKGFDILFEVVPLSGRITLRTPSEKKA